MCIPAEGTQNRPPTTREEKVQRRQKKKKSSFFTVLQGNFGRQVDSDEKYVWMVC